MVETGIREVVLQELCELARKHNLDKVILFGSRARGDYKRTSDIDLAVTGGNVAHAYNQVIALDIVNSTKNEFYQMFCDLKNEIEDWI